jgi:hypothetical protein
MASEAVDREMAAAMDQINAGLSSLLSSGLQPVDRDDALTVIREVEALGRRMDSAKVAVLAGVEDRGLHRADHHASAKVMVAHAARLSPPEAGRRAQMARALRQLPAVKAEFEAGRIGTCQVSRISRAFANVRVRSALIGIDEELARLAARSAYRRFDDRLTDWVRQTDEDGTRDTNQRHHENRDASIRQDFDGSWRIEGGCASVDGAVLHDILERFVRAELEADWEKARAEHGEAATADHLPRTAGQRRFDAFANVFQRAAAAEANLVGGSQIVTNIVIDATTYERYLAWLTGLRPSRGPVHLDRSPGQPGPDGGSVPPVGFRCSTLDGHQADPTEAVARSLVEQVRRVVLGARSTVIDQGRRQRLFTGSAQLAVRLANTHCYWPGCQVPVSQCQTDHLTSYNGPGKGSTSPGNGGPACGKHNRAKEHGFIPWRDEAGEWHVQRPDGTLLE